MTRLTKPQAALLSDLAEQSPLAVSDTWPPAKRLVALGYAKWVDGKYSKALYITPAGRAALKEGRDE